MIIILAMVFWGASFPAMKYIIGQMNPYFIIWIRMTLGACCILPFISKNSLAHYQKGDWFLLLLMVLFEPCLYFYFELSALKLTTASQAGFVAATLPLMVIASSALILKEKIYPRSILGITIAFAGIVMLTFTSSSSETSPNPILGNMFECLAMGSATAFTLILKKLTTRYSPLFLTLMQTLGGVILFFPSVFFQDDLQTIFQTPPVLAVLLFLGIVVTVFAYIFYITGIKLIPANEAIVFVNLIPVFGLLLSMIFLSETLNLLQGAACLLVLSGIGVGQIKSKTPPPNPASEAA